MSDTPMSDTPKLGRLFEKSDDDPTTHKGATGMEVIAWILAAAGALILVIAIAAGTSASYLSDAAAASGWATFGAALTGLGLLVGMLLTGVRQIVRRLER